MTSAGTDKPGRKKLRSPEAHNPATGARHRTPFVSVVTVSRENLAGLKRTGASLAAQSCRDYEWIVVDGGSRDGTPAYLQTQNSRHPFLLWCSEKDAGLYDAMNKGLGKTAGTFVIFMNAGDVFAAPDVLDKVRKAANAAVHLPDFIYGDSWISSGYKKARPHKHNFWRMFTHHQAMFYQRDIIDTLRYDLKYKIASDYDFTLRFLRQAQHVLYCSFAICRFEPGGLSQRRARQGRAEQFTVRRALACVPTALNLVIYAGQSLSWTGHRLATAGAALLPARPAVLFGFSYARRRGRSFFKRPHKA